MNWLGDFAAVIGKGLFAGAFGTAVMTASSTVEMKLRGREASSAPAEAAGIVLGVEPRNDESKERFSNIVHLAYGTVGARLVAFSVTPGLRGPLAATALPVARP